MKYRCFEYALPTDGELNELNTFLASHRISACRQYLVRRKTEPMLVFVVEFDDGITQPKSATPRIDYREVLSETAFRRYNKLRELRKQLADAANIQVYNIFNNAQLAAMIEQEVTTLEEMASIPGVRDKRLEKYGAVFLKALAEEDADE